MLELVSLEVENFRSIEHGFIDFDRTTVLIGENGSGKSTLIEALSNVLDPRLADKTPEFHEYHFRKTLGKSAKQLFIKIRLRLTDSETLAETDFPQYFPKRKDSTAEKPAIYEFTFNSRLLSSEISTSWSCINLHDGARSDDPHLLGSLRLLMPAIHLKPGALVGHVKSNYMDNEYPLEEEDRFRDLKERINLSAMDILLERTIDATETVNSGFAAVKELVLAVSEATGRSHSENGLALKLREMLQMFTLFEGENLLNALNRLEQNTEKIGALMLVNALIISTRNRLEPYSQPVLIIEQPEVFLHTKTLANIRTLVQKINWQKVVTTNSGMLLSTAPFKSIRRVRKRNGQLIINKLHTAAYSNEDLRRISYHMKARHPMATFARLWILVEGESEHWIIPQLARILEQDLDREGIAVIDFAQIGLNPLIKYATELGIDWHVMVDGDDAGLHYAEMATTIGEKANNPNPVTTLPSADIEHYFWDSGFEHIYIKLAKASRIPIEELNTSKTIKRAIKNTSKPFLALSIIESIAAQGPDAIPGNLEEMITACVQKARIN